MFLIYFVSGEHPSHKALSETRGAIFTQTTWVEIFCMNIKVLNLTSWENDPLKCIYKSVEQTKRVKILHRLKSQPMILKISKRNRETIWLCKKKLRISTGDVFSGISLLYYKDHEKMSC